MTISKSIIQTLNKYEPRSLHHEADVVWGHSFRHLVWDIENKGYIDFTSGIFVANIGHSRGKVVRAMIKQLEDSMHSYVFPTEIRAKLVEKLCEMTGFEKVYLCSTGSEAVEAALRCMWTFTGRPVYKMEGAFHGNTLGAKSLKTMDFLPNSENAIVEGYRGYDAHFWDKKTIRDIRWRARVLCFDEIKSGFGRTGKLFAYEHYGVKPDLIVIGKALGGGMPISAVLGSAELLDAPDDLSSTHTGNPVCCAAALASIEVLEDEKLVDRAKGMGEGLEETLPGMFPNHKIQGKGMIWAIDLKDVDRANQVVDKCAEKGLLLVKTHMGTIKIGPPLIIPGEALMEGLTILRDVIYET